MDATTIGTIVAGLSLGVTIWKIQRDNIREFSKISVMVTENEKRITEHKSELDKELVQVKTDRADRVRAVYEEIEKLKAMRETDVGALSSAIEKTVEKSKIVEEKHHTEVMGKIDKLTIQLTEMCATFTEYRKTRNGHT